jgi:hypothetical protein
MQGEMQAANKQARRQRVSGASLNLQQSDCHAFEVFLGDFARGVKVEEVECDCESKRGRNCQRITLQKKDRESQ